MISKGIMEISNGAYKVGCACGNSECDLMLLVDEESINMYSTLSWNDCTYINNKFLEKIYCAYNRIKTSIKILFTGKFELSSELIIIDDDQIKNIIQVLQKKPKV